ncbi:MAG: pyruvate kinase [Hyphomicrobium aestuarii]|nr:pyruvate kinase [Hyphomicrobium aestuarii]
MRRNRKVKIVATLGPASSTPETMERLVRAGVDVFRVNMSHASHDLARELHARVRRCEQSLRYPIGILYDLQGPKFRLGAFAGGRAELAPGAVFHFDRTETDGDASRVFLPHPQIFDAVEPGHALLLDDGKIRMRVIETRPHRISAEVVVAGPLASRKGVSLPDTLLAVGPLTEKDEADLAFGLELGVDWIALSFVQRGTDVADAQRRVAGRAGIMSKIEKPSAITDLEAIIEASDAIMVARGDLGVEMPIEKVPGLQKYMTRMARAAGKPVVVATQMLESMITAPVPTRAEVSDVATAVFDGADAVMLSAESAVGQYPFEAISMMDRIGIEVEADPMYDAIVHATKTEPVATGPGAIATAARTIGDTLNLKAIVCYTATGSTALRVARERPGLPVIGLTPVPETARRLSCVWGIRAFMTSDPQNLADMVSKACRIAFEEGFAKAGEGIVITAGVPLGSPGATNMIRIAVLDHNGGPSAI